MLVPLTATLDVLHFFLTSAVSYKTPDRITDVFTNFVITYSTVFCINYNAELNIGREYPKYNVLK